MVEKLSRKDNRGDFEDYNQNFDTLSLITVNHEDIVQFYE